MWASEKIGKTQGLRSELFGNTLVADTWYGGHGFKGTQQTKLTSTFYT